MKKFLYLLLLCAATLFTSCEKHDAVDEMVGVYTFTETGTFVVSGNTQNIKDGGSFRVSRKGQKIIFSGDFEGEGVVDGNGRFTINFSETDYQQGGANYHIENTYSNCFFSGSSMSWQIRRDVWVSNGSNVVTGVMNTKLVANKQ